MRVIVAFLVAPLATPASIALVFLIAFVFRVGWFAGKPLGLVASNILTYTSFAVPLAYAATLVLGVPVYFLVRRRRTLMLTYAAAIGAAVALAPLFAWFAMVVISDGIRAHSALGDSIWWTFLFAISGASSGALFWAIALRRPDSTVRS